MKKYVSQTLNLRFTPLILSAFLFFVPALSALAGQAACLSSKPNNIHISRLGGYSHHAFTAWAARVNVTVFGTDANNKAVSVCGVKITFLDQQGFSASCTTQQGEGGRICQATRGYGNSTTQSRWKSVSIEHAGVKYTKQLCQLTAKRPSGWFSQATLADVSCKKTG